MYNVYYSVIRDSPSPVSSSSSSQVIPCVGNRGEISQISRGFLQSGACVRAEEGREFLIGVET